VVGYEDVQAAAERLRGVAHRTAVAISRTLDERLSARLVLKCENLQRAGAFKFRGAYNATAKLAPADVGLYAIGLSRCHAFLSHPAAPGHDARAAAPRSSASTCALAPSPAAMLTSGADEPRARRPGGRLSLDLRR
jgi:hypothetical protein